MKQSKRIKKLQLFLYGTGRMHPGSGWNVEKQGYPGEFYRVSLRVNGIIVKSWYRKKHMHCKKCDAYGTIYVGRSENNTSGYDDCPHCNGSMWSRKAYRF